MNIKAKYSKVTTRPNILKGLAQAAALAAALFAAEGPGNIAEASALQDGRGQLQIPSQKAIGPFCSNSQDFKTRDSLLFGSVDLIVEESGQLRLADRNNPQYNKAGEIVPLALDNLVDSAGQPITDIRSVDTFTFEGILYYWLTTGNGKMHILSDTKEDSNIDFLSVDLTAGFDLLALQVIGEKYYYIGNRTDGQGGKSAVAIDIETAAAAPIVDENSDNIGPLQEGGDGNLLAINGGYGSFFLTQGDGACGTNSIIYTTDTGPNTVSDVEGRQIHVKEFLRLTPEFVGSIGLDPNQKITDLNVTDISAPGELDAGGQPVLKSVLDLWQLDRMISFSISNGVVYDVKIRIFGKEDPIAPPPPTNTSPDAKNDSKSTAYQTPVDINVLANDTDPNGDPLTIQSYTQGAHGTVSKVGNLLKYTPANGYSGTDTFTYIINDGQGGTDTATVTVTVEAAPNTPPTANPFNLSTQANTAVNFNPISEANAHDAEGSVTVKSVGNGAHGTVTNMGGGLYQYTPTPGWPAPGGPNGTDSFGVVFQDTQGLTVEVTVTVTVEAPPPPPPPPPGCDLTIEFCG